MRLGNCGDICDGSYTYAIDEPGYPVGQIVPTQSTTIPSQQFPAPTTMTMPGMVTTAQLTSPNPQPSLTPRDLVRSLPSIVDNQPTQITQCNSFSEWVDQNPLLAGGVLLGLAWLTFGRN